MHANISKIRQLFVKHFLLGLENFILTNPYEIQALFVPLFSRIIYKMRVTGVLPFLTVPHQFCKALLLLKSDFY